jgi:hypothetical protein
MKGKKEKRKDPKTEGGMKRNGRKGENGRREKGKED